MSHYFPQSISALGNSWEVKLPAALSEVHPHVVTTAGVSKRVSISWGPTFKDSHNEVSLCTLQTDAVHAYKRIKYTLGPCVLKQGPIPFSMP